MDTNINELFRVDSTSEKSIVNSFENISKTLFFNYEFRVNNSVFHFTEIEFYYYHESQHPDKNTHEHSIKSNGRWRGHNQGLDMTFQSTEMSDGGILIRGLKRVQPEVEYINGSRRVIFKLFSCFNDVLSMNSGFYLVKLSESLHREKIFRTSRQGITQPTFLDSKYRYFTEFDKWDIRDISSTDKIRNKSTWEDVNY